MEDGVWSGWLSGHLSVCVFGLTHLLRVRVRPWLPFFPVPYSHYVFLQSLLGDGPLRLLLLPSIHLDALDLLSALILA